MGRRALSFFFSHRCPISSGTAPTIACGREISRWKEQRRENRLARKSGGEASDLLAGRDSALSLFQKRLPCRRRSHRPRHSRNNRRRNRSSGRNRKRMSCSDRSEEKLFRESGSKSRRNRRAHFPDEHRVTRDRVRQTRTAAGKTRPPSLVSRHSFF